MHKGNFDKATANKVDKAKWIKAHAAHGNEDDLGRIWDELQAKPKKVVKDEQ